MKSEEVTLNYYNQHAEEFASRTIEADLDWQQRFFMSQLPPPANSLILDLGCGSGRDSVVFLKQGFRVIAIDGSPQMCKIAKKYLTCPVICATFKTYQPKEMFDGIWANAALLHLNKGEILNVMKKLAPHLKAGGIFYLSFKYGEEGGMQRERFFQNMTESSFQKILDRLPEFQVIQTTDETVQKETESIRWLNIFLRKK